MAKKQYDDMVHKRVHVHKSTNVLLTVMAELMDQSYRDVLEAAILYGLAYMNESNNVKMTKWLDTVRLPSIEDVDKFILAKASGWDDALA